MSEWESVVESEPYTATDRLRVPGGWLYRVTRDHPAVALAFVPDPPVVHPQQPLNTRDVVTVTPHGGILRRGQKDGT